MRIGLGIWGNSQADTEIWGNSQADTEIWWRDIRISRSMGD